VCRGKVEEGCAELSELGVEMGYLGLGRVWWTVRRKNAGIVVGGRMPLVPLHRVDAFPGYIRYQAGGEAITGLYNHVGCIMHYALCIVPNSTTSSSAS
jgi:hypothetical protein